MASTFQQSHSVLLEDLPPELLRKVVDFCAHDIAVGRVTLLSLSVMNKYFRDVTAPRLFERICFRDSPESPGDEILDTIRRFKANPYFRRHPRTVSLHLNRLKWVGTDQTTLTQPYHYLVLPELVDSLVRMPEAKELYIRLGGEQGARCLDGLHAAVHWCLAGRKLNITSLTVSTDNAEALDWWDVQPYFEYGFLRAMPQIESFCYEGTRLCSTNMTLSPEEYFDPSITPRLTQVRLYCTYSDHRSNFYPYGWTKHEFSQLRLSEITPELQYLSVLGALTKIPVSSLLEQITKLTKLKYLDITDEQTMHGHLTRRELVDLLLAVQPLDRLAYIKDLAAIHPLNENRSKLAADTFDHCENLRRICFVRSCVGEVYLRGYPDAVADSTGYVSPHIKKADLIEVPERWHHGVPQTGLMPFPNFTPWEGIEEATY